MSEIIFESSNQLPDPTSYHDKNRQELLGDDEPLSGGQESIMEQPPLEPEPQYVPLTDAEIKERRLLLNQLQSAKSTWPEQFKALDIKANDLEHFSNNDLRGCIYDFKIIKGAVASFEFFLQMASSSIMMLESLGCFVGLELNGLGKCLEKDAVYQDALKEVIWDYSSSCYISAEWRLLSSLLKAIYLVHSTNSALMRETYSVDGKIDDILESELTCL